MERAGVARAIIALVLCCGLSWAQKYSGPRPPKPDIPYLQHADNLVETEVTEAREEERKKETVYTIAGAASAARTPLAEPIFLLQSEKVNPEKIELYALETKDGSRQIAFPPSNKRNKNAPRPMRLMVTRLDENLYRIEVNEPLDNGEYSLTPAGSNQVFCFQVY